MKKYNKPEILISDVLINEVILLSVSNKDDSINFGDLDGKWQDWE